MKLPTPDWKSAWFENHIGDRLFQEVARLEKSMLASMTTSAHWMEQVTIETGQLAQTMIRLEGQEGNQGQLRQCFDKALRLGALSLLLMSTLEHAEHGRGGTAPRAAAPASSPAGSSPPQWSQPAAAIYPFAPAAEPVATTAPRASASPPPASPPAAMASPVAAPVAAASFAPRLFSPFGRSVQHFPAPSPSDEDDAFLAPGENGEQWSPGLLESLSQVAGPGATQDNGSEARHTIAALSDKGLSRAEIEMVTGQPRHIVEAVLEHQRKQRKAQSASRPPSISS